MRLLVLPGMVATMTEPPAKATPAQAAALGGRAIFKLNDQLHNQLIELIGIGCYAHVACKAAGVPDRTFYRWLKRGKELDHQVAQQLPDGEDLADTATLEDLTNLLPGLHENDWRQWRLWRGVQRAEARGEAYAIGQVQRAMKEDWRAAIAYLERKHPKRWRRRDQVELTLGDDEDGDDEALLEEGASELVHDALRAAAKRRALPAGAVDGEATELE